MRRKIKDRAKYINIVEWSEVDNYYTQGQAADCDS